MAQFDDGVKCPKCGTWGAKKSLWKVKCVNPSCEKADPNDYLLRIRYRNFRGNEIIYSADARTAYQAREYVVVRLAPTGKRVAFKLDRIQNRSDVESAMSDNPVPSGNERRILHYHLKHGSSSPAFEKLRLKYPNYQD
jgi:hypothetical protein